jgi:hypothetical protein
MASELAGCVALQTQHQRRPAAPCLAAASQWRCWPHGVTAVAVCVQVNGKMMVEYKPVSCPRDYAGNARACARAPPFPPTPATLTPTHPPTHPPTHAPTHPRTHAPTHPRTHAPTHPRTHARTHARTHPPTHPRTHPPTHPRTHPRTQAALWTPTHSSRCPSAPALSATAWCMGPTARQPAGAGCPTSLRRPSGACRVRACVCAVAGAWCCWLWWCCLRRSGGQLQAQCMLALQSLQRASHHAHARVRCATQRVCATTADAGPRGGEGATCLTLAPGGGLNFRCSLCCSRTGVCRTRPCARTAATDAALQMRAQLV